VTFIAYFLAQNDGLGYCTVDADFGRGIVRKSGKPSDAKRPLMFRDEWNSVKRDPNAAFQFLQKFRYTMLNLASVDQFVRAEAEGALMSQPHQQG
jgi:hypothetical protein